MVIAIALVIIRMTGFRPAVLLVTIYVEFMRNVPLLVQMFIWYFAVPEMMPEDIGRWMKRDMPNPEYVTAVVALGLYTASRVAEQVRAGIEAVGPGLTSAAYANGFSTAQAYRYVLLPISFRLIVPPMTSEFLTIFKNSSLALTIGLLELTAQSQQIAEFTFQGFEAFTAATVIYVCIALMATLIAQSLERFTKIPGFVGKG
jgi:glutamate/aspartate transport system permease protein